jgi:hypothetical protein
MASSRDRTALERIRARPRTWAEARLMLLRERGVPLSKVARALGKGPPGETAVLTFGELFDAFRKQ